MTTAPFLINLVGVLSVSEFAMVPGVYILFSPQDEEVHSSSWGHRYTHSEAHSSKRFKPLPLYYYSKATVELEKNTNKELSCVYVACNLTKKHFEIPICFWFQLMSLSSLFLKFGKSLVLNLGCDYMTFNFATQMTLRHLLPMTCPWIKNLSAKTTRYNLKCWEGSVKRKSNVSFTRVIKNGTLFSVGYSEKDIQDIQDIRKNM